jgi:phage/plasmid-like protein (TIGR03299 family)
MAKTLKLEKPRPLNEALIGYTEKRGKAWHYQLATVGGQSNAYPGAIPVQDVRDRLFDWVGMEGTAETTVILPTGVSRYEDETRKAIVRSDTGTIFEFPKRGYQIHQYQDTLVDNVERILDAGIAIGQAGLMRGGAQAWIQVEMAETMSVHGVDFRPYLTAVTSMDGSLATQYVYGSQLLVCSNMIRLALNQETANKLRVKHTRNSLPKVRDARAALGIIHTAADDFTMQVNALIEQTVTDMQWEEFVGKWAGTESDSKRSITLAERKQDELRHLWTEDERVAPWANTAYGVLAMVNTYGHHYKTVKNVTRAERNIANMIDGTQAREDRQAMDLLASILV